jgi:hypothetical protein
MSFLGKIGEIGEEVSKVLARGKTVGRTISTSGEAAVGKTVARKVVTSRPRSVARRASSSVAASRGMRMTPARSVAGRRTARSVAARRATASRARATMATRTGSSLAASRGMSMASVPVSTRSAAATAEKIKRSGMMKRGWGWGKKHPMIVGGAGVAVGWHARGTSTGPGVGYSGSINTTGVYGQ